MIRPSVIAIIGFAAAAAAAVLALSLDHDEPSDLPPPPVVGALAVPRAIQDGGGLAVDVVRIGAAGDSMIAGRAAPQGDVALLDGEAELGHATADANGEWVFVPDLPLAAGAHQLTLHSTLPGGSVIDSDTPVVLIVPERDQGPAMAFAAPRNGPGIVLLAPAISDSSPPLALTSVSRDPDGRLFVGGRAAADATVHLYLDNRFIGRSRADAAGVWRMAARAPLKGQHPVRVDQVDGKGKVTARVELPWDAGDDILPLAPGTSLLAKPGAAWWRVARRLDEAASTYIVVYQPAPTQMRDPEIIYPGQVFSGLEP